MTDNDCYTVVPHEKTDERMRYEEDCHYHRPRGE